MYGSRTNLCDGDDNANGGGGGGDGELFVLLLLLTLLLSDVSISKISGLHIRMSTHHRTYDVWQEKERARA